MIRLLSTHTRTSKVLYKKNTKEKQSKENKKRKKKQRHQECWYKKINVLSQLVEETSTTKLSQP